MIRIAFWAFVGLLVLLVVTTVAATVTTMVAIGKRKGLTVTRPSIKE